jgi:hypothetical protein
VTCGPSGAAASGERYKGEAEQKLLDKALESYPHLFTADRIWIMDRNFPGAPRIQRLLATGTHVLIRVKDGITLHRAGGFLPDGSYLASICGGSVTLTVRVIECTVTVAGADAPELFALITDLDDHAAYPAQVLAAAYHWRWIGPGTCLKEAKSAISGAGPSTGPMLRSASPALVAQEHAAWVTATELARATARAAAAITVPAGKGKRAGQPVHPREISFTAARRAVITSTRAGAATASMPAGMITASREHILAGLARRRAAAPSWTAAGTATARPRPGWASRPAGRAWPPAPRPPRSASAAPSPPDPLPRPAARAGPWNRPPPGATAGPSACPSIPTHRSHSPLNTPSAAPDTAASAQNARSR